MYRLILALFLQCLFFTAIAQTGARDRATVVKELKELFKSFNDARVKHDRAALERIYADDFIIIHSSGFVEDKTVTINETMSTDSARAVPIPDFENLVIYGDVAIFRQPSTPVGNTVASGRAFSCYICAEGKWLADRPGTGYCSSTRAKISKAGTSSTR